MKLSQAGAVRCERTIPRGWARANVRLPQRTRSCRPTQSSRQAPSGVKTALGRVGEFGGTQTFVSFLPSRGLGGQMRPQWTGALGRMHYARFLIVIIAATAALAVGVRFGAETAAAKDWPPDPCKG